MLLSSPLQECKEGKGKRIWNINTPSLPFVFALLPSLLSSYLAGSTKEDPRKHVRKVFVRHHFVGGGGGRGGRRRREDTIIFAPMVLISSLTRINLRVVFDLKVNFHPI